MSTRHRFVMTPNLQGAIWILASAVTFTGMTTLVKLLAGHYGVALQAFYAQVFGLILLLPIIIKRRSAAFATTRPVALGLRALASTLATTLSYVGYAHLPLTDANAISFTKALWIPPLAALLLKEKLGPVRIGASIAGFLGVLIMVRPGMGGHFSLGLPALAMVTSSFLFAASISGMKVLSRDQAPLVILIWSVVFTTLLMIPGALLSWRWPLPQDLILLVLLGACSAATQFFYVRGMTVGDAAALAPIDYIRLIFAVIAGFVVFGDVPSIWTGIGAAVVVAATMFLTLREHQQARVARLAAVDVMAT